jgi:hypothetical protein
MLQPAEKATRPAFDPSRFDLWRSAVEPQLDPEWTQIAHALGLATIRAATILKGSALPTSLRSSEDLQVVWRSQTTQAA